MKEDLCGISMSTLRFWITTHTSIGCEPSKVFHGRVPYNVLNLKMGIHFQRIPTPNSQTAEDVFKQTEVAFHDIRDSTMQAYIKYKAFYDKKANASKLKEQQYVYLLQPKADNHGSKIPFPDFWQIGPHIVEKALPNKKYLVPKTRKQQIPSPSLHEMTSIHAQTTHTRRTNDITTMETWPWSHHKTRWSVRQSMRIWIRNAYSRQWPTWAQLRKVTWNKSETWFTKWRNVYHSRNHTGGLPRDFPPDRWSRRRNRHGSLHGAWSEASPEQLSPTDIIPRSTNYDLRHNPKLNCNDTSR